MSLPVVLRRVAQREFHAAADWYDDQRPGLGMEFIDEIQRVLDQIGNNPESCAVAHVETREALSRRFPYAVYYRVEDEQVVVLAIIHTARDPSIWQRRT
jgi:toxin ParE1/3/4